LIKSEGLTLVSWVVLFLLEGKDLISFVIFF
jgi:hypothetical protein